MIKSVYDWQIELGKAQIALSEAEENLEKAKKEWDEGYKTMFDWWKYAEKIKYHCACEQSYNRAVEELDKAKKREEAAVD